jgi:hypothetical protein
MWKTASHACGKYCIGMCVLHSSWSFRNPKMHWTNSLLTESWVELSAQPTSSHTPDRVTPLPFSSGEEYLRLLREAQRESNQSSARVSVASSRRDTPRDRWFKRIHWQNLWKDCVNSEQAYYLSVKKSELESAFIVLYMLRDLCTRCEKWTHKEDVMSVHPHASFPKLHVRFR